MKTSKQLVELKSNQTQQLLILVLWQVSCQGPCKKSFLLSWLLTDDSAMLANVLEMPDDHVPAWRVKLIYGGFTFPCKPFRNEFIPVFIPNEILVLVRNFFLVSWKLKTNFVPYESRKSCSLGAGCACMSDLARKPRDRERQSRFITWIMQYELHSGTKLIPEWKSLQPLNAWTKWNFLSFLPFQSLTLPNPHFDYISVSILLFIWSDTHE